MRQWNMWIKKGCFDLLVVIVAGTAYYLLDFVMGYEMDAEDAVGYYMMIGFLFSFINVLDKDRKCAMALRFGAERKNCCIGIEISRAIYILGFLLSLAVLYPVIQKISPNSLPMLLMTECAALTASSGLAGILDVFCKNYPRYKVLIAISGFVIEIGILILLEFSVNTEFWILSLILLGIAAAAKTVCLMQERKYLYSCNV